MLRSRSLVPVRIPAAAFRRTGEKTGPNQIELAGSGFFKCFISETHHSRTVVSFPTLGKHSTSGSGVTYVPRLQSPTAAAAFTLSISPTAQN